MKFDKTLGSFVFAIMVGDEVYTVTCPREGRNNDRDGKDFAFHLRTHNSEISAIVSVSRTLLATTPPNEINLSLVILRVLVNSIAGLSFRADLHLGNIDGYNSNEFSELPTSSLRNAISEYVLKRYDIVFDKPFSVVEIMAIVKADPEDVMRQLHYLHKHEGISFNWSPNTWQDRGDVSQWLPEEFSLSNANLGNLERINKQDITLQRTSDNDSETTKYDFFICHASEDKDEIVEPLAIELSARGSAVWYDRWSLTIGDSLSQKIDLGLAQSRFGIVILSPAFFAKQWPQRELSGLVQKEVEGHKVILPVWHNLSREFLLTKSPTLADRLAANSRDGIQLVADKILEAATPLGVLAKVSHGISNHHRGNEPARVAVGFEHVSISDPVHIYGLTIRVQLIIPPDQGRMRVKLIWPQDIPITKLSQFRNVTDTSLNGLEYTEYALDFDDRIFAGETLQIVGGQSGNLIEYKFNNSVWSQVQKKPRELEYTLYLEDHAPISGRIPFTQLHVF